MVPEARSETALYMVLSVRAMALFKLGAGADMY